MARATLSSIQSKVKAFHEKMNAIAAFLKKHKAPPELQIDTKNFRLQFFIDKESFNELVNMSKLKDWNYTVVLFGLEDLTNITKPAGKKGFGQLTAGFLGVDENGNVLSSHKKSIAKAAALASADGQNTWPPPPPPPKNLALAAARPANKNDVAVLFTLESKPAHIAKCLK